MFTKTFKQITRHDAAIAGGKGASLGEMTNAKMQVPPGFVVLAGAFDSFLEETELGVEIDAVLRKANVKNISSVEDASEKIRAIFAGAVIPADIKLEISREFKKLGAKLVAVRSSATAEDSSAASWAGELETYLNVTEKNLHDSVKQCWSSLFTSRAIFYRVEKKMQTQHVAVAVVVQKMVQSEVSGITFTVHPVTEDRNQMIIEAGWGLGEAIVGGMVTPDTYVINKEKLLIEDKNISEQAMMIVRSAQGTVEAKVPKAKQDLQKLPDAKIKTLAKICSDIEKHYGFPCDIEWAMEKGKIYITQSRPITTLK